MLTQISNFWFDKTAAVMANHLTHKNVTEVLPAGVDGALYARDVKRFSELSAKLQAAETERAAAETRWLELEILREDIEGAQ